MLEKIPSSVGRAIRRLRAGFDKIAIEDPAFTGLPDRLVVESPAFDDGRPIPPRYTADGPGISPPLRLSAVPEDAEALALIVEDPDAPAPEPLVHLIAWDLPPDLAQLPEGEFRSPHHAGLDEDLGRNSLRQAAWLPPDPPRGHGPRLYVFQLFALDRTLRFDRPPSRKAMVSALRDHAIGKGMLTGTYERA
jgi:Raf kinase inhibitor-like YbhB/YbcL family protein